ncbi:YdcF family protein [Sphingobacteriaceae bacterium WQ 2009]|uniref:YdcF family protein n=1 Tax=Rhinopithecimicrobium faecis TaxID=2820698 RepID=A0A8T4HBW7_9SPHI|nr:YdcF family protein [Sphingobacteriaceae bacterium WQ 2009]
MPARFMHNIILTLGAANDQYGNLNKIAEERLLIAFQVYKRYGGKFLCTGGFGSKFNKTHRPHAFYAKNFLIELGASSTDIMNIIVSSNTVDDMRLSKDIIDKLQP